MAFKRTDDLDGSDAAQETFGFDGKAYVIDLSPQNKAGLMKALQKYLTVATEYGVLPDPPQSVGREVTFTPPAAPVRAARRRGSAAADPDVPAHATVRTWANNNGYQVAVKGRIPDAVMAAYAEAH